MSNSLDHVLLEQRFADPTHGAYFVHLAIAPRCFQSCLGDYRSLRKDFFGTPNSYEEALRFYQEIKSLVSPVCATIQEMLPIEEMRDPTVSEDCIYGSRCVISNFRVEEEETPDRKYPSYSRLSFKLFVSCTTEPYEVDIANPQCSSTGEITFQTNVTKQPSSVSNIWLLHLQLDRVQK